MTPLVLQTKDNMELPIARLPLDIWDYIATRGDDWLSLVDWLNLFCCGMRYIHVRVRARVMPVLLPKLQMTRTICYTCDSSNILFMSRRTQRAVQSPVPICHFCIHMIHGHRLVGAGRWIEPLQRVYADLCEPIEFLTDDNNEALRDDVRAMLKKIVLHELMSHGYQYDEYDVALLARTADTVADYFLKIRVFVDDNPDYKTIVQEFIRRTCVFAYGLTT